MARIKLKYVHGDRDRHGNVRYYFYKRSSKRKIRLKGLPGSKEFMSAYQVALDGKELPRPTIVNVEQKKIQQPQFRTLYWLCSSYFSSVEFNRLADNTKKSRRNTLRAICSQPLSPTDATLLGDLPFEGMTSKAIRALRNRKKNTPTAANDWIVALSCLFKWAIEEEHAANNPARDVPKIPIESDGWHTWTLTELEQFEARHAVGTQARLAMGLLAYTGLRRSDVIRLGPQHRTPDDHFKVKPKKTLRSTGQILEIPILAPLVEIINATPCPHASSANSVSALTYLVNKHDRSWTDSGFATRFKAWCVEAELPHCSAHGIRKAAACAAAENGATEAQMMALFGWRQAQMAQRYTRAANRKKMTGASIHLLAVRQNKE